MYYNCTVITRVICKRKGNETMGLVPNPKFMSHPSFLMLKSSYTKSGVGLIKK